MKSPTFILRLCILLFCLQAYIAFSQNNSNDLQNKSFQQLRKLFFANEDNFEFRKKIVASYLAKAKIIDDKEKTANAYYYFTFLTKDKEYLKYCDSIILLTENNIVKDFPILGYIRKVDYFTEKNNLKLAFQNLLYVQKLSLKLKKYDYYYSTKVSLGFIRHHYLNENQEALKEFLESYKYYKDRKEKDTHYKNYYEIIIFSIAETLEELDNIKTASKFNELGDLETKKSKNYLVNAYFKINKAAIYIKLKKYNKSLYELNSVQKYLESKEDLKSLVDLYYYKAISLNKNKDIKNSIIYFNKVDSIDMLINDFNPKFINAYNHLIDYNKKMNNNLNVIKYSTKLLQIKDTLQERRNGLYKNIYWKYELPKIINSKQEEISYLNIQSKWQKRIIILSIIISSFFLVLFWRQKKKSKQLKEKFDNLMSQQPNQIENKNIQIINESEVILKLNISEIIVTDLVAKLERFENEKGYLQQDITIDYLVNLFDSNSNYVSKIINHFKKKSISQYINDLRIEYVVEQLKIQKNWRKFTIQALAFEIGFSSADSFARAFTKKTGLKPSYFIKSLNTYNSEV